MISGAFGIRFRRSTRGQKRALHLLFDGSSVRGEIQDSQLSQPALGAPQWIAFQPVR